MTLRCLGYYHRLVSFAVAGLCLLAACQDLDGLGSSEYAPFYEKPRECTGVYTPGNDACWMANDGGDEGQLSADFATAQENQDRLKGGDLVRCAGGIVSAPGIPGTLRVTFTTVRLGGKYAPKNCGAVWIEDALGFYVRTLELWAGEREKSVVAWSGSACHSDKTIMDAITSATLDGPQTHVATWDARDYHGNIVADGTYTLWLQVTENEIFPEGPFVKVPIMKGLRPAMTTIKAMRGFSDIQIAYTPGAGAAQATAP